MKILCTKHDLLTGVNTVQKAVSSKSTLPILQGILLKAENQKLVFAATDLEIGIRCEVPANVMVEGTIVVPSRLFGEIVRKLPDVILSLELTDNTLKIEYQQSDITLKGYDAEEFPLLPELMDAVSFTIPTALLKTMIKQTVFACSSEGSRPVFTGLLMQIEGGSIRLVATDTHRLAYRIAEIPGQDELHFSGIIPAKTMSEIYRLLREEDEILNIRFNKNQVEFEFGTVRLLSRLIEGQFPNYKQAIPQACETKAYVSVRAFLDAVERASLMARDSHVGNIVRLTLTNESMHIAQTSEMGKILEQINIGMDGKEIGISFNAKFIMDALRILDTDDIVIELSGPFSAAVIRPLEDPNYLYLVLPVRTA
ncbi:MAG: DNA polymerase III subunit beta [Ruminiclostridium sp.]